VLYVVGAARSPWGSHSIENGNSAIRLWRGAQ
jgi:hypothetical protein